MAKGIDVYTKYQTVTDWWAVRGAGYEFAYIKVSDGITNRPDGGYGPAGRAADVKMGAYHYAQPGDPVAQANRLVDRAAAAGLLDLAPALDLEAPFVPNQAAKNFAIAFLRQIKARGHRACLYANNSMLTSILPAVKAAVPDVLVWVARYGATPTVPYDVWQHSDKGSVHGIQAGSVDLNTGTVPLNTGGTAAPTPTPTHRTIGGDDVAQTKDYDACPVDSAGKRITRMHTFVLPVGRNSEVTAAAWLSFKCAGAPGVAEYVRLMSIRGDDQKALPGGQYPVDKEWTNVAADRSRVYISATDGQDQFTAMVRCDRPYSLTIEIKAK